MGLRALVLVGLMALVPLAGCLSDEDETQSTPTEPTNSNGEDESGSGNGGTGSQGSDSDAGSDSSSGDSGDSGTGGTSGAGDGGDSASSGDQQQREVTMSRQRYEGNLSGADAGLNLTGPEAVVNVTIDLDATRVWYNLSVNGSPVQMDAKPPGCESQNCTHTTTTEDGQGVLQIPEPEPGTWRVRLHAGDPPALVDSQYDLLVTQKIVTF